MLNNSNTFYKSKTWLITVGVKPYRVILLTGALCTLNVLVQEIKIATAFKEKKEIAASPKKYNAIEAFENLQSLLNNFYSYHSDFGDAYTARKDFEHGKSEYLRALRLSSVPDFFIKTSYCYQQLKKYDSSIYYTSLAEKMQPYKLSYKLITLSIYIAMNDKTNIISKAKEIIRTPEKFESKKGQRMKAIADSILKKIYDK